MGSVQGKERVKAEEVSASDVAEGTDAQSKRLES